MRKRADVTFNASIFRLCLDHAAQVTHLGATFVPMKDIGQGKLRIGREFSLPT